MWKIDNISTKRRPESRILANSSVSSTRSCVVQYDDAHCVVFWVDRRAAAAAKKELWLDLVRRPRLLMLCQAGLVVIIITTDFSSFGASLTRWRAGAVRHRSRLDKKINAILVPFEAAKVGTHVASLMHHDNGVQSQPQHRPAEETPQNGSGSVSSTPSTDPVNQQKRSSIEVNRRRRQSSTKSNASASSSSSAGKLDNKETSSSSKEPDDSIIYEMKLVDNVIRSMRVGKVFRDNQDTINHMHFSADGASLISSADDDQVRQQGLLLCPHVNSLINVFVLFRSSSTTAKGERKSERWTRKSTVSTWSTLRRTRPMWSTPLPKRMISFDIWTYTRTSTSVTFGGIVNVSSPSAWTPRTTVFCRAPLTRASAYGISGTKIYLLH